MLKSFKIEFEIQHTVHTMDCYDPDFEAFVSNFRPILRARESGKTAALVSNLCPKASDPQYVGVSSKDDAQQESQCCTSAHCQSDSDDLQDDHETSTEWQFEGQCRAYLL